MKPRLENNHSVQSEIAKRLNIREIHLALAPLMVTARPSSEASMPGVVPSSPATDPGTSDEIVVCMEEAETSIVDPPTAVDEVERSGIVALMFSVVDVMVDVEEVDVVEVVVVEVVVVELVVVVVHFEQTHARGPSNTSLLTPNLQHDWVCKL
jgi:hypothetical protein